MNHVRYIPILPKPQLNATPLIDVMLVLLVMLIFTVPVATHAVKLNLPQGPAGRATAAVRLEIYFRRRDLLERTNTWRRSTSSLPRLAAVAQSGESAAAEGDARETRALRARGAGAGGRAALEVVKTERHARRRLESRRQKPALRAHRRLGDPAEQQHADREPLPAAGSRSPSRRRGSRSSAGSRMKSPAPRS